MDKHTTIVIADDSYDCPAHDGNCSYSLYLDPEARRVCHWEADGNETPMPVWDGRAVLIPLPIGAVGEHVARIVRGEEFRGLVEALFGLYEGAAWDGGNHVGRWRGADNGNEYSCRMHELRDALEGLFDRVPSYWAATDWFAGHQWGDAEANDIRQRVRDGETLEAIADELVADARPNDAYLCADDVRACIATLLGQHPATCDDGGEDERGGP